MTKADASGLVVAANERASRIEDVLDLRDLLAIKEDLMRLAVHELRRPLTLAAGYLSMLQDRGSDELPETIRTLANQIAAAHHQLSVMLADLVGVIQLDDRTAVLHLTSLQLGEVVTGAIEAMGEAVGHLDSAQIESHIQDPETRFPGDSDRLRVALVNLIDNAIKYGPVGGHVRVRGRRLANGIAIAVTDEGAGIDPSEAAHLFEAHRRGEHSGAPGGLGLGLTIVRRIVELHGGHITVDSPPGLGATFTIHLPLEHEGRADV